MEIKKQTGQPLWKDSKGIEIPNNRILKSEKLKENYAFKIAKSAQKASELLSALKQEIRQACAEIEQAVRAEASVEKKDGKGNFTWYNFDESIKIERNITEPMRFDDMSLKLCKETLDEFLDTSLTGNDKALMVAEIVKDAFSTTRGKVDVKKVVGLQKYEKRVNDPLYTKAMDFARQGIRRPESKTYYTVSLRNSEGEYVSVKLDLASI